MKMKYPKTIVEETQIRIIVNMKGTADVNYRNDNLEEVTATEPV